MGRSLVSNNPLPRDNCQVAKDFHSRGWMPGTAGNLSARENGNEMWITASGKSKGKLLATELLKLEIETLDIVEQNQQNNKPSAETEIHQAIYQLFPQAKACFHVHTVDACLATNLHANDSFMTLPNLEMIKGFDIWEQSPNIALPVFDNHLDVSQIANDISTRFSQLKPDISALMIRDHGVTVWGSSIEQTYNRVEIIEFIFSYMAKTPASLNTNSDLT